MAVVVVVVVVAEVAAAAGVEVGAVAVAVEAAARLELPRRKSRVAALPQPSAWLSSSSHPQTTPRGARADRSCGPSTCEGV